MTTRHAEIDSPLGELTLVADDDALTGVYFRHHWYRPSADTFGPRVDAQTDDLFANARIQLTDYLAGLRRNFDLPIKLHGDETQRRVWNLLTTIPYGETITYGELAAALADGTTAQEVGQAVGRNPLSIVVPCHRVVGKNGQLTGLRGRPDAQAVPARTRRAGRGRRPRGCSDGSDDNGRNGSTRATGTQSPLKSTTSAVRCCPGCSRTAETEKIRKLYPDDHLFRATIDMRRYRFGEGEYRYFQQPYPEPIEALKQALYPRLLPIARDWWTKLGRKTPWPDTLDDWLDMCHKAGQTKSTAILLKYGTGDWNALHRDLYGDLVFPLQVVVNLSEPGVDHTGGEFLLVEQRPRAQSRGTATLLPHGHGFVFTTRERPVRVDPRLVGIAGPARRVGHPLRRAFHARSGVPRCRVKHEELHAHRRHGNAVRLANGGHPGRTSRHTHLRSPGLSFGTARDRTRRLRHPARVLRRRSDRYRRRLPALCAVSAGSLPRLDR